MTPIRNLRGQANTQQQVQTQVSAPQNGTSMSPWKRWITGALNAAISGVISGGTAQFVGVDWKHSLMIAGASAFGSFSKWMPQHPLPGAES